MCDMTTNRTCKYCHGPIDAFGRTGQKGRPPMFCRYEHKEAWVAENLKAATIQRLAGTKCATCGKLFQAKSGKAKNCSPACSVRYQNKRKRKITPNLYDKMLEAQGGLCAICKTDKPGGKGDFHVDHNHVTGAIRGLLCHNCNTGIGSLGDDPMRIQAAAEHCMSGWGHNLWDLDPEALAVFREQGETCGICLTANWGDKGPIRDRAESGELRGVLCHRCSLMLYRHGGDPKRMRAAAQELLERTRE